MQLTRTRLGALLLATLTAATLAGCSSSASAEDVAESVLKQAQDDSPDSGYESAECDADLEEVGDTAECTLEGENEESGAFTQTISIEVVEKDGDTLNFDFTEIGDPEVVE